MQKVKILFLITDFGKGGAERYLIDLCHELNNYEHIEYCVGSLFDNNQNQEFTKDIPIENLDYNTFSLMRKNENTRLKELIDEFQPDIIHTHRYLGEFISSYYVNKKIKYVCHGHDNMIQMNNFSFKTLFNKNKLLNYIEKKFLTFNKYNKVTTYFIANSTHTLKYYKKVLPKKTAEKVRLIQYGFNYTIFQNKKARTLQTSSCIQLINVGSFQDKKNQTFLVDVANELKQRGIEFKLLLIGDGQNRKKIIEKVNQLQLDDVVEVPGIIHNVQDYYNSSDIYVHSAHYEPFGLVFLEAMAAGLPVISLDGKGNKDIIEHGKNGFFLDTENVPQFADYITELIESPKKYSEISENAKKYSETFDIKVKTIELVEFYKSILS